jgi:ADP-ribosylglycohydrolase
VLRGVAPVTALNETVSEGVGGAVAAKWVADGLDSTGIDTRQAILDFGQMCEIDAAFPATVHLIAKYESDLQAALVENVMAGGDSSSRGMVVGIILGAHLGLEAVPASWISEMKQGEEIARLLGGMG